MALNPTPPSSQMADVRPISFILWDKAAGEEPFEISLAIRPEDMTRSDTSRVSVQQTLGSPFIDDFGEGLPTISINGHTGWRSGLSNSASGKDGIQRLIDLREQCYKQWHARRQMAVDQGNDPNLVELIYSDSLDQFVGIVVPTTFVLRRSKSSPLLCRYSITMIQVAEKLDPSYGKDPATQSEKDTKKLLGIESLTASINSISDFLNNINNYIQGTIVAPIKAYVQKTVALLNAVTKMVNSIDSIFDSVIQVARLVTQAGCNIFHALAMIANLPSHIKAKYMQVAGAYSNAFCVLSNATKLSSYYQDYSLMLGSSNCSSTSGGSPLSSFSKSNTFSAVAPMQQALPVAVSSQGASALQSMARTDLVNSPMSTSALQGAISQINSGMTVNV